MVITLDRHKKPLGFTTEKRARQLMERRRACIHRYSPFTIILMDKDVRECKDVPEFRLKIDPGSVHTGMAVTDGNKVLMYLQCEHRAGTIKKSLDKRNTVRWNRRERETRYRRSKFADCGSFDSSREEGWLPPSVKSIGDNVINITKKLKKLINITQCSFEAARFNTQLLDNPEIEGKQYQQGTLMGYEMKEYLMWRYRHTCQYCGGLSGDSVLEWEHMFPSSRGGSDSVKNATLACHSCNHEKDNMTPKEWLVKIQAKHTKSKLDEERILRIPDVMEHKVTGSDRYCACVSSVRRYTEKGLFDLFDTVECASGGRTKYNRTKLGLQRTTIMTHCA